MTRLPQLDALRAIAVLLVLSAHLTWKSIFLRFGWTGVDLFFVLSGFLISGLLFRDYKSTGKLHLGRFMIRRGLKIYPAYYFLLAATVIGEAIVGTPVAWSHLWPDLIFVQNYRPGTWGHLWSLGVEEQFYLFLPLCLFLMIRKSRLHWIPFVCIFIAVTCMLLRAIQLYTSPFSHIMHCTASHLRFDALFYGVLLSYFREFRAEALDRLLYGNGRFLLGFSLLGTLPALLFDERQAGMYVIGLTTLYLGYGGLLLYFLSRRGQGLAIRCLSKIGMYSYSIYLFHLPIAFISIAVLQDRLHWNRDYVFFVYMLASIVVGIGISRMIEYPVLRLRDQFFPAEKRGPLQARGRGSSGAQPVTLPVPEERVPQAG